MSDAEVKNDVAAEAPTAEELKGVKRAAEDGDDAVKKQKTEANGEGNGHTVEEEDGEEEEEDGEEEEDLGEEEEDLEGEGDDDLDDENEGEEDEDGEEEEGEGEEEEEGA